MSDARIDIGAFEFGAFFVNYDVRRSRLSTFGGGIELGDGQVDADSDPNNGDQVSLRGAIQELNTLPGEGYILFSPGVNTVYLTLQPSSVEDGAASGDLDVTSKLTIRGAGSGATLIDGGYTPGIEVLRDRIFHVHDAVLRLEALTIRGGHAIGANGGALLNDNGTLEIVKTSVAASAAEFSGGAIYSRGDVYLSASSVIGNNAGLKGAGICIESGAVTIGGGSRIELNYHDSASTAGVPEKGGGIYLQGGSLDITGASRVLRNVASVAGGGIYIEDGTATISGQSIIGGDRGPAGVIAEGNTTVIGTSSPGVGGGIYNRGVLVIKEGSRVEGNNGGGIWNVTEVGTDSKAKLTVNDSHIHANVSSEHVGGGGIYAEFAEVVVSGGSISHNLVSSNTESLNGAGIYSNNSAVTLVGTVVNNHTIDVGGGAGIYNEGLDARLHIINSTIDSNTGESLSTGSGVCNNNGTVEIFGSTFANNVLSDAIGDSTGRLGGAVGHYSGNYALVDATSGFTTLTSPITNSATTLEVNHVAAIARFTLPFDIWVDSEQMTVTGIDTSASPVTHTLTVQRGRNGSLEASHSVNARIYGVGGSLTISNSTFSANSVFVDGSSALAQGGAIYNEIASNIRETVIEGCTFFDNQVDEGPAIYSASGSVIFIQNSVFARLPNGSPIPEVFGNVHSGGSNFVAIADPIASQFTATGDQSGTVSNPLDPLLGPLQDNGGPTLTHAPLPNSPVLEVGSTTGFTGTTTRTTTDLSNAYSFETQLTSPVTSITQTVFDVDVSRLPTALTAASVTNPFVVRIDTELLKVTSVGSSSMTVVRGCYGTSPATAGYPIGETVSSTSSSDGGAYLEVADASVATIPTTPVRALIGSEVVLITGVNGNLLTVERAVDRSPLSAHAAGVSLVIGEYAATHGYHGLDLVLSESIASTMNRTDFTVAGNADALPPVPFIIMVDQEQMLVETVDHMNGTTTFTVRRSILGTPPTDHTTDSTVLVLADQTGSNRFGDSDGNGVFSMDIGSTEAPLLLQGTANDDSFSVSPGTPGRTDHRVNINGSETLYDPMFYDAIKVIGLGGRDRITINGKPTTETACFNLNEVFVSEVDVYKLFAEHFRTITVISNGGNDTATLAGSQGDDLFLVREDESQLRDYDDVAFLNRVVRFGHVTAYAGEGNDQAEFFDSAGNDRFEASPTAASIDYANNLRFDATALNFDRVVADFANGGADLLFLLGSGGTETFIGTEDSEDAEYEGDMTDGSTYHIYLTGLDINDLVHADTGDDTTEDDTLTLAAIDYLFHGYNW